MRMSQSFQQDLTLAGVFIFVHKMNIACRTTSEIKTYGEFGTYDGLIFWSGE